MYRFENNLLPVSFKKYFTNLDCIHAYDTHSKQKASIFFQNIKQIMGKSHFNILALNYGQKFLRKLNVYLTIYLICMNYLMHDCLFIYFFSLIFILYIYLLIFFLNYNLSVRCKYSFLFISCLLTN